METDDAETENEADEEVWAGLEQKEKQKREENDSREKKGWSIVRGKKMSVNHHGKRAGEGWKRQAVGEGEREGKEDKRMRWKYVKSNTDRLERGREIDKER